MLGFHTLSAVQQNVNGKWKLRKKVWCEMVFSLLELEFFVVFSQKALTLVLIPVLMKVFYGIRNRT